MLILLSLSILLLQPVGILLPSTAHATLTPQISVLSLDYPSPKIQDPSLVPGSTLNISIQASNLPPVTDLTTGGLQGFDITLDYNGSVLKPVISGSVSPFCPDSEECLFANQTRTQVYTFANKTTANGSLRIGMIVYNQQNRISSQGTLLKIEFQLLERGVTSITIDQNRSQLIGYYNGCGSSLTNYTVSDANLDNRPPWQIIANPSTITVARGASGSVSVTVVRVNSDANVTLLIPSGGTPITVYKFTPDTGLLSLQSGNLNFTSSLTFTLNSTATSFVMQIVAHDSNVAGGPREYRLNYTVSVPPTLMALATADPPNSSTTVSGSSALTQSSLALPSLPLIANFTYTAEPSNPGTIVYSPTVCGGVGPYTYQWSFGDGVTSSMQIARHTYSTPGTYQTTLSVTDSNGTSFSSREQTVVVEASPPSSSIDLLVVGAIFVLALGVLGVVAYYGRMVRRSRRK